MRTAKAVGGFILLLLSCLLAVLIQKTVLLFTKGPLSYLYPPVWHRGALRIFGIKVLVEGQPVRDRQVLYVSNHISYFDIAVLGSLVRGSLVSKAEVKSWPGWGFFGTLQQVAYISRSPAHAARERAVLDRLVADGKNIIMFPEGTSTDNTSLLPFKSAFFSLATDNSAGRKLTVQPITITLLSIDGRPPRTVEDRDLYTWHRDMTTPLGTHIWRFAQLHGATVRVEFHPAREATDYPDRKALAAACQADIAAGLHAGLAQIAQTG